MKFGFRKPSLKKSISARTTGKIKRKVKSTLNPLYGEKGMGVINDPKKAIYNKIYDKSSVGVQDVAAAVVGKKNESNNSAAQPFDNLKKTKQIRLQNIVCDMNEEKLVISEQQLICATNEYVNNHINIINTCVKLVNETLTPSVFFDRYDMLIEHAKAVSDIEQYYYFGKFNTSPTEALNKLIKQRPDATKDMIKRYWENVQSAINSLKTDKAKINRCKKFFETMEIYKNRMDTANWEFVCELTKNFSIDSH